jgi:putative ABC transport system permease protein
MAVPLSYNFRNLLVRKTTTAMTALGIALTVAVLLGIQGLLAGLERSFQSTGHPLHLLVMRQGATSELSSVITPENVQVLRGKGGIRTEDGQPMLSPELVSVLSLGIKSTNDTANVNLRGLSPIGIRMRAESVKLAQGRWFAAGQREVVVGKGAAGAYQDLEIGRQVRVGRGDFTIVGIFDAGQTAFNGEVWGDNNQTAIDAGRPATFSSVLIRVTDQAALRTLAQAIANEQRVTLETEPEVQYYLKQTESGLTLKYLGLLVAIVMAVGSVFAAMNTMYAAVVRRAREIGVLRVLGFSRASILFSFVVESLLLALLGGALACLLTLPFNGFSSRIGNWVTFSQSLFEFRVTPEMFAAGMTFAAAMGVLGGLLPARMAARKDPLAALREL